MTMMMRMTSSVFHGRERVIDSVLYAYGTVNVGRVGDWLWRQTEGVGGLRVGAVLSGERWQGHLQ